MDMFQCTSVESTGVLVRMAKIPNSHNIQIQVHALQVREIKWANMDTEIY
jgi:hypothetical protein